MQPQSFVLIWLRIRAAAAIDMSEFVRQFV